MKIVNRFSPYGTPHNAPRMIVIHAMAEYLPMHATEFLDTVKLSAHVLAAPDGTLYRCREDTAGAHHAKGFNMDSVGLEVLVEGKHDYGTFIEVIKTPYVTEEQYKSIVWQCQVWLAKYQIERVVRHSDLSPGRKVDPGAGFPWGQFLADIGWVEP